MEGFGDLEAVGLGAQINGVPVKYTGHLRATCLQLVQTNRAPSPPPMSTLTEEIANKCKTFVNRN